MAKLDKEQEDTLRILYWAFVSALEGPVKDRLKLPSKDP